MSDTAQKFAHLAEQIVEAMDYPLEAPDVRNRVSQGLYDAISQTLAQIAPSFEQAGQGHVNIQWESIMDVIDIPALQEGWDRA